MDTFVIRQAYVYTSISITETIKEEMHTTRDMVLMLSNIAPSGFHTSICGEKKIVNTKTNYGNTCGVDLHETWMEVVFI